MCAVLAAWGASFFHLRGARAPGTSVFIETLSGIHLAPADLLRSLLFPGSANLQLSVGWSLEVEMIFSFALPLLLLAVLRTHWLLVLAACAVPVAIDHPTLKFGMDFVCGISLFLERERLSHWLGRAGDSAGAWMLVGALLLINLPLIALGPAPLSLSGTRFACMGFGAAALTACAAFLPLTRRVLATAPCLTLGRISYSLYLVHYPIILLLAPRVVTRPLGLSDFTTLLAAVLALALPIAALSHRFVELPAIRWGSRLVGRIAPQEPAHLRLDG